MGMRETVGLLVAAAVAFGFALWRFEKPREPVPGRLLPPPWIGIMLISAVVALIAAGHLIGMMRSG